MLSDQFGAAGNHAKVEDGHLQFADRPGIGFEAQKALYAVMRDLAAAD